MRTTWMVRVFTALTLLAAVVACTPAAALAPKEYATVSLADLPKEARETMALIRKGGPFPYSKDGVVFGNYEKALPAQARGFYHEYTVPTPGARNRGAKRIVCGGKSRELCYYSDDHYRSFKVIQE
ncbi:MAG: ribonuclease N [Betaproteobacteria bacterium]|nr:ribonuclease N [Betaproteobacteria bacterium]